MEEIGSCKLLRDKKGGESRRRVERKREEGGPRARERGMQGRKVGDEGWTKRSLNELGRYYF